MSFLNKEELIKSIKKEIWSAQERLSTIECKSSYLNDKFKASKDEIIDICHFYSQLMMIADGVNLRLQEMIKLGDNNEN